MIEAQESKTFDDVFDRMQAIWGYSLQDKRHWGMKAREYELALKRYPVPILDLAIDWRRDHSNERTFPSISDLKALCESITNGDKEDKQRQDAERDYEDQKRFAALIKHMGEKPLDEARQRLRKEAVAYLQQHWPDGAQLEFLVNIRMAQLYRERGGRI